MSQPLLTFFSIPKPFAGTTGIQQRNAVASWLGLGPQVDVVLLGDDAGVAEAARDLGARHIPSLPRNRFGTPLVSAAFDAVTAASTARYLCYVNADIIFLPDLLDAVRSIWLTRFLMSGRRWDVELREPLDVASPTWQTDVRRLVERTGTWHSLEAMDYFIFPRGLISGMPPFAVGRAIWDNWLLFHARSLDAAVVDASRAITPIHQNHDYAHTAGGQMAVWYGPEAKLNRALAADMLYPFTLADATWVLTSRGPRKRNRPHELVRRLQSGIALRLRCHAATRRVVRTVLRAKQV